MKPHKETFHNQLERSLECSFPVPQQQIESAWEHVISRAAEDVHSNPRMVQPPVHSQGPGLRFIFASAAVVLVILVSIAVTRRSISVASFESENGSRTIEYGELVRSSDQGNAMIALKDGSRVEMQSQTELSLGEAEDGIRIHLNKGAVIVTAAKQRNGHLYVQTKDMTISVLGTVFFVNAEEAGSRVAVIEGEVRVEQGSTEKRLRPGEQAVTHPSMPTSSVSEEVSWSPSATALLALLQQSVATPDTSQFEVISVRQESGNPGVRGAPVRCNAVDGAIPTPRGGGSPAASGNASSVPRGRCVGRYVRLIMLISTAYGVPERNVSGGPDWIRSDSETFQVEAKAEAYATATRHQLREMLQKLLADRFQLRVRRDTKEAPGYALGLSKGGSRLPPTSGDEGLYLEQNGQRNQVNLMRGGQISVKGKATLQSFADYLEVAPVIALNNVADKTNLAGIYEFSLTLNMLAPERAPGGGLRGGGDTISGPRIDWDPSISKAMEEQLGLSLISQRASEEVIVIEHVEKLSEN